jgi:hypothetical protein
MRPVENRGRGVTGSLDTNTNHSYYLSQVKSSGSFASCMSAFATPSPTARSSQPPSEELHGWRNSGKSWACPATVADAGAVPGSCCSKSPKAGDPRKSPSPRLPEPLSAIEEYLAPKMIKPSGSQPLLSRLLGTRLYRTLQRFAQTRPTGRRQHRWAMIKQFVAEEPHSRPAPEHPDR